MSRAFHLTLKCEGHNDLVVEGEFNDHEYEMLLQYLDQHEQLVSSKPLREGFPCELSLKWDQESGLRVDANLPDNDTLSILLHRLRPFILKKEPASFVSVTAVLGRRLDNPYLRQLLKKQHMLFDGRQFQQMMQIVSNDVIVNSDQMLSDWLNSHEYHRDLDKRQAVDDLFARTPGELSRAILISMVVDKVKAVRHIASLVAVVLGQSNELNFKAHEIGTD